MFMLMLMLLPPIGADITQSSKFFDPIKNASFEDATPCWETSNGGERSLISPCPHGSYAWYTGLGEYQMWQWLDSETLYDIKGKRVSFSYWFKEYVPGWAESDFSETHHWYPGPLLVKTLTYTPPAGVRVHLTKVKFDVYVEGGEGKYVIEYQKGDDWEHTVVIAEDTFTNTQYQTKEHSCDVWGNPGESLSVKFFTGADGTGWDVYSTNYYMYYRKPAPARAGIFYTAMGGPRTYWSNWVFPNTSDWQSVFVETVVPPTAGQFKVIIHGQQPNFRAWIDLASLWISTAETKPVDWPNQEATVAVSATLFQVYHDESTPPDFPDCKAYLAVGMGVERHNKPGKIGSICVRAMELDVKLLTHGVLNIYYCEQTNEHNVEIDPEKQEQFQNQVLWAGGIAITGLIAAFTYYLPVDVIYKPYISVTSGTIGKLILQSFASDPHIESANKKGKYVREKWDFEQGLNMLWKFGKGSYGLKLEFFKDSIAQVEVTARVYWGLLTQQTLLPYGKTEVSTKVTVQVANDPPETPSTPSDHTVGYVGATYDYSTSTTDPEGKQVRYEFDWGDGSTPTTTGWKDSGVTATASHSWSSAGTYQVKVRAQDEYYEYSDWSYLTVTIRNDDLPPTNPTDWSGSHHINVWERDDTIDIEWWGASDEPKECSQSGVYGYSYTWDTFYDTIPDTKVDTTGTNATSPVLDDGNSWYFHVRTVDKMGNWNPDAFDVGPFFIDMTAPSVSITPGDGEIVSGVVLITASVSDAGSGPFYVEFYIDGVYKDIDFESPYQYSWDTTLETTTTTSRHTIKAVAYDKLYHESTSQVTVYIDRHDVAVTEVKPIQSPAYQAYASAVYTDWGEVNIVVKVKNEGAYTETFDVTLYRVLYHYSSVIGTKTVTLARGASRTLYPWNIADVPGYANYTLKVEVSVVSGETDTADNTKEDGIMRVRWSGDANDDGHVNASDFSIWEAANGTQFPYQPDYDWQADFNGDGYVDNSDRDILYENWGRGPLDPYPRIHDVAVINVRPRGLLVGMYPTWQATIIVTVTVRNEGTVTETFSVTVWKWVIPYQSGDAYLLPQVTVPPGEMDLIFSWSVPQLPGYPDNKTAAWPYPTYTFSAEVSVVSGETDTADNSYTDGTVKMKWPGDANGDGYVNGDDMENMTRSDLMKLYVYLDGEWMYADPETRSKMMEIYGAADYWWTVPGKDPAYRLSMDFNGDGTVNNPDFELLVEYWGEGPLDT